jgi:PAS domain S-box-containing protein
MTDIRPKRASGQIRLLLVDDNEDNLISLEATLTGLADELVCAQSGTEVLRHMLENDDFAAILLDVKMPEMDGFEIAEIIRTRRRHTPILFLTAFPNNEHLSRGYDLGAVDFLFKPIVPEILRSKVSVFVELARNTQLLREKTEVLAKAEQKFRALLEATPDAMFITRNDGEIVMVNSHSKDLLNYERRDLVGRNLRTVVPDWHPGARASGGSEFTAVRKGGQRFPVEISQNPLHTDEGLLITSVVRDISERKQAEESIRQLNSELERRVVERTAALMRSNDALRQFAWAASHDLQEPLRMVVAFSQLLQKKNKDWLNPAAGPILEEVIRGALRMNDLLAALRDYMQASEGGGEALQRVDANECLNRALNALRDSIEATGAEVTRDPLPTVIAVEILLAQVFQNLIGNALKYRNADPVKVHVAAERQGNEWLFSVSDNGIGIDPFYHERIFGVFKRLHRDEYPGAGMGLAICKGVIERLGGRIWVESQTGQGATFRFTVPVGEEEV